MIAIPALSGLMQAKPAAQKPLFKTQILFTASKRYPSIRIPCILALPDNAVIAVVAGRSRVSDWADMHLLMRRSTDGGKTWEPERILAGSGKGVADNPVLIWDEGAKTVHFIHQTGYERVWHLQSTDSGKTFSEAVDITPQLGAFKREINWNVIATGPGHGVQLKNGRLLVPTWLAYGKTRPNGERNHSPSVATSIYSDDHGKTWHCGEILPAVLNNMNETAGVEADAGGVIFFTRSGLHNMLFSFSPDGTTNWTNPVAHKGLFTPICFSSVLRISGTPDKSRVLFCNPDSHANPKNDSSRSRVWFPRENLTVKLSYDECRTWSVSKVIEPGPSSYSDLAVLPDGTILCLYENDNQYVSVARFNLEWLTNKKDTLSR